MPGPTSTGGDALAGLDWEALFPRLLLYATWVHRGMLAQVGGAPEPGDLVQEVLAKVLQGRRTLPAPSEVTTVKALQEAIRSEASNARARAERRGTVRLVDAGVEPVAGPDRPPGGDEQLAAMWRLILSRVGDDPDVRALAGVLQEDPAARPGEIEQRTGMSRVRVYRAMRTLRYRLGAIEGDLRHLAGE